MKSSHKKNHVHGTEEEDTQKNKDKQRHHLHRQGANNNDNDDDDVGFVFYSIHEHPLSELYPKFYASTKIDLGGGSDETSEWIKVWLFPYLGFFCLSRVYAH